MGTVYGVNLGSWLVIEPWMMKSKWSEMTRGQPDAVCSEFDLWSKGYPETADQFKKHWSTWVTKDDIFNLVYDYGINTFRIPVGYWIAEELTYYGDGSGREPFPLGGWNYLVQALGWIKEAGAYAILDLHGAPGGQVNNPFTGQCNPNPGFYNSYNYGRATQWARAMTRLAHNEGKGVVFAIEAVNEPEQRGEKTPGLQQYYTDFTNAVRDEEQKMGVTCKPVANKLRERWTGYGSKLEKRASNYDDCVNLMFMDMTWQTSNQANPAKSCKGHCIYDDHNYACFGGPPQTEAGYLRWFCDDDRIQRNVNAGQSAIITGEFSLCNNFGSAHSSLQKIAKAQTFKYTSGVGGKGYIFWNFKTEGNDPSWNYRAAVDQGIMPRVPGKGDQSVCFA